MPGCFCVICRKIYNSTFLKEKSIQLSTFWKWNICVLLAYLLSHRFILIVLQTNYSTSKHKIEHNNTINNSTTRKGFVFASYVEKYPIVLFWRKINLIVNMLKMKYLPFIGFLIIAYVIWIVLQTNYTTLYTKLNIIIPLRIVPQEKVSYFLLITRKHKHICNFLNGWWHVLFVILTSFVSLFTSIWQQKHNNIDEEIDLQKLLYLMCLMCF